MGKGLDAPMVTGRMARASILWNAKRSRTLWPLFTFRAWKLMWPLLWPWRYEICAARAFTRATYAWVRNDKSIRGKNWWLLYTQSWLNLSHATNARGWRHGHLSRG